MLKLKLQLGHLMQRTDSLEKILMLGNIEGRSRRGWQRIRRLDGITDSMAKSWWWTVGPGMLQSMGLQRPGHDWATELRGKKFKGLISVGKESAGNAGDLGLIPGLWRSAGEGIGYPLQYSGLENSMDCIVNGVAKSQTWLSDFHFHFQSWMTQIAVGLPMGHRFSGTFFLSHICFYKR